MIPEFILMLTYNDETVKNALQLFNDCKNLPVDHWGFKDVGLPPKEMMELVTEMKKAKKKDLSRSCKFDRKRRS